MSAVMKGEEDCETNSACSDSEALTTALGASTISYLGRNSVEVTAGLIVADVVGAGILVMPRAVACFGWALGVSVMVICLAGNVHIAMLMWRVYMGCSDGGRIRTYAQLCAGAFDKAPEWQRRWAMKFAHVMQYIFLFSMMGIYILSAGKGLGLLFYTQRLCLPQWAALACVLVLPFAVTSQKLGGYDALVWINILTLLGTILTPLLYYTIYGVEEVASLNSKWVAVNDASLPEVMSGLCTFTFAMTSQMMLTEITSEMQEPAELPKAYVKLSTPFQLACFVVAGLGGYYFLGDKVTGMITENLPFNAALQFGGVCLLIHMLVCTFIKSVVLAHSNSDLIWGVADHQPIAVRVPWPRWTALCFAALFCAWLLANIVPFFGDAVSLVGAVIAPLSCFIMPILMFARYYTDSGPHRPHVSQVEWACIALEFLAACVLLVVGTYTGVQTLREHWRSYGYPFECHCEGIWNTCACSGAHIGMDSCMTAAVS